MNKRRLAAKKRDERREAFYEIMFIPKNKVFARWFWSYAFKGFCYGALYYGSRKFARHKDQINWYLGATFQKRRDIVHAYIDSDEFPFTGLREQYKTLATAAYLAASFDTAHAQQYLKIEQELLKKL
jgi:hypothetical protein